MCGSARRGRLGFVAVACVALFGLAACGGDQADAGGIGGGSDSDEFSGEPTIQATFDITGSVTLKETITNILPARKDGTKAATCEEYAKGYSPSSGRLVLDLPNFVAADEIDGHSFVLDGRVSHYTGPGTYQTADLSGTGNPIGFSIDGHALVAKETSVVTVTVKADGSGSFVFDELTETSTGITNPQSITGSLTWTCQND